MHPDATKMSSKILNIYIPAPALVSLDAAGGPALPLLHLPASSSVHADWLAPGLTLNTAQSRLAGLHTPCTNGDGECSLEVQLKLPGMVFKLQLGMLARSRNGSYPSQACQRLVQFWQREAAASDREQDIPESSGKAVYPCWARH